MLKAIVENKNLRLQLMDSNLTKGYAILPLKMRYIREIFFQDKCLIVPAPFGAIASAQNDCSDSNPVIKSGHIFDARRFSGPTKREVSNAYDGD